MNSMVKLFTKGLAVMFLVAIIGACSDSEDASGGAEYPTKPIEVVVPVGTGGDTDLNTRITAKYLEQELGESIVITNVEGSGGSTGIKEVLSKEADGYAVLAYHNAMLVNNIYGLADYTSEDFKYAGVGILDQSNTFLASKDAEFDDLESLIEHAKDNPRKVKVATEVGAMTHLQILEFEQETGVEFNIVDAGGASDKITALLGGRVDIVPTSLGDRKSTRLNSSHVAISYAVFCLKKKNNNRITYSEEKIETIQHLAAETRNNAVVDTETLVKYRLAGYHEVVKLLGTHKVTVTSRY